MLYLALDGSYHPIQAALASNPTLRDGDLSPLEASKDCNLLWSWISTRVMPLGASNVLHS
jgi:hypothetical protein